MCLSQSVDVRSETLAEWTGLEPATPDVTGRYSNQLNYHSVRINFVPLGFRQKELCIIQSLRSFSSPLSELVFEAFPLLLNADEFYRKRCVCQGGIE